MWRMSSRAGNPTDQEAPPRRARCRNAAASTARRRTPPRHAERGEASPSQRPNERARPPPLLKASSCGLWRSKQAAASERRKLAAASEQPRPHTQQTAHTRVVIRARSCGALYIARPHGTRLQHFGARPPRPRHWPPGSRAGAGAHRALTYAWSSEAGCLRTQALPPLGAGGLVVRSCTGPSQALAPVRRVEGGSHAADQARGPSRTARPVRLRGGSMAGTEWASEIRVVNASDTLRFCVRVVPWGLYCTAGLEVSPVVFLPPWLGSGDGIGGRVRRPVVRTC